MFKILCRFIKMRLNFMPLYYGELILPCLSIDAVTLNLARQDGRTKYDDKAGVTNTTYAAEQNMSNQKARDADRTRAKF